jgi:hypothetical protein
MRYTVVTRVLRTRTETWTETLCLSGWVTKKIKHLGVKSPLIVTGKWDFHDEQIEFSKLRNDWKFHLRSVKLIAVCHRSMTVHNSCLFTLCSCPAHFIGVTSAMGTRRCPPFPIQSTSVGFPPSPPGEVPSNHTKHGPSITPQAC